MKKKNILLALSGLLFLFAGCSDDAIVEQPSAAAGQEVQFGITSEAMKSGRTIYTGKITEDGTSRYEGVNWLPADMVRMYCQQSANTQFADYSLQLPSSQSPSAQLLKTAAAGLQWGNSKVEHVFYGVYPSPKQFFLENVMDESKMLKTNGTFEGYIPRNQRPASVKMTRGKGGTIATPNMDYAYMGAKTVVPADQLGEPVSLSFVPFVTSLELSFVNKTNSPINLTGIEISSVDNTPIWGKFSADLSQMGNGKYPVVRDVEGQQGDRSSINVTLFEETGGSSVVLKKGQTLTLTMFLHCTKDLQDLNVTVQAGSSFRRGKITGVTIQANKKNFIRNIPLNNDFNVSNWITYLPDNAIVRELSIPGAGGVGAGYGFSQGLDDGKSLEQTLTIEQLWDRGIRAFELSVSRNADGENIGLGEEIVSCNGKNTILKLQDAVDLILGKLSANRGEFAMLIVTYQPTGIKGGTGRNCQKFMDQLNKFWRNDVQKSIGYYNGNTKPGEREIATALYTPSTATVGASRGKLFCIARPTSAYEDDLVDKATSDVNKKGLKVKKVDKHILVINGWGSLKDKWQARGYSLNMYQRGPGMDVYNKPNRPFDPNGTPFSLGQLPTANFFYGVQAGRNEVKQNGAWVQEWARVSKGVKGGSYYWANTYEEKCQRINEAFLSAMNGEKGKITYINSLCGYYVDPDIEYSYTPYVGTDKIYSGEPGGGGLTGDVVGFARDINLYVYKNLFKKGLDEVTGPLGIVLMDRVGTDDSTMSGSSEANNNLPYLIIANNFRFDLKDNNQRSATRSSQLDEHYDFIFDASANK